MADEQKKNQQGMESTVSTEEKEASGVTAATKEKESSREIAATEEKEASGAAASASGHTISETWAEDTIADLDEFIESQGIYIRQ
ncbi:MAG: hypothetical protein LUG93_17430 [Lachnospiraceae bacterium]|nr:hypothetical protein [Lachnospiraceae bacterium]